MIWVLAIRLSLPQQAFQIFNHSLSWLTNQQSNEFSPSNGTNLLSLVKVVHPVSWTPLISWLVRREMLSVCLQLGLPMKNHLSNEPILLFSLPVWSPCLFCFVTVRFLCVYFLYVWASIFAGFNYNNKNVWSIWYKTQSWKISVKPWMWL